jgi:hypothetical protein
MFIFHARTVFGSNMRLAGKSDYTCEIVNNKENTNIASKISSHIIR